MAIQPNQEPEKVKPTTSVNQPDGIGAQEQQKLSEGVPSDDDESAGEIRKTGYMNRAEAQVRENEDASLQDDSYTFDSDNTDSDEGIDDFDMEDVGLEDSDDYL